MNKKKRVVVVGGGTAGISTTAQLLRKSSEFEVTIVEPADKHFYQPLWTLVGGGIFEKERSAKTMAQVIPNGAKWIQDRVQSFLPEQNAVKLENGPNDLEYDYLIVCPGIQIEWHKV